jgi:hypothetical protein
MICSLARIAFSLSVSAFGSPAVLANSGRRRPSVWSTSYLGIRQAGHGRRGRRRRHLHGVNSRCPFWRRVSNRSAASVQKPCPFRSEVSGKPSGATEGEAPAHGGSACIITSPVAFGLGARLGLYEVSVKIGVGGIGEAYRATNTSLDCDNPMCSRTTRTSFVRTDSVRVAALPV